MSKFRTNKYWHILLAIPFLFSCQKSEDKRIVYLPSYPKQTIYSGVIHNHGTIDDRSIDPSKSFDTSYTGSVIVLNPDSLLVQFNFGFWDYHAASSPNESLGKYYYSDSTIFLESANGEYLYTYLSTNSTNARASISFTKSADTLSFSANFVANTYERHYCTFVGSKN